MAIFPLKIGDAVRLKPPFSAAYPDVYIVEGFNEANGAYIIAGADVDPIYIEPAEEGLSDGDQ